MRHVCATRDGGDANGPVGAYAILPAVDTCRHTGRAAGVDRDTIIVEIAGIRRELPLFEAAPGLVIPVFNMLGDVEVVEAAAAALAPQVPAGAEMLVTTEAKSIPLAHTLAVKTGLPYVVLRKVYQPYMGAVVEAEALSVMTGKRQALFLEEKDRVRCAGRKVVLVADVISSGSNAHVMRTVMNRAGAEVIAEVAVFTEGNPERGRDVIALGHLPLFAQVLD